MLLETSSAVTVNVKAMPAVVALGTSTRKWLAGMLTVVLLANASTQDVIQNFFKEYSRDHPGIDFNISIIPYTALTAKINTMATAGEPPDILLVTTSYIQTFAEQALDLAQYTNGANV